MLSIAAVGLLLALGLTAYASWRGAPWLPTPRRAVAAVLDDLRVGPGDHLVDIGAGDARVLLAAARRGASAEGYELSPFLWLVAWLRTIPVRENVTVRFADGFSADLSRATVVFAFLRPRTMPRFAAAVAPYLCSGDRRVVTYAFPLPKRPPVSVLRLPRCVPLYVYASSPSDSKWE